MKYVIMANGKGLRWNNYGGHTKHLISIENETLLERTNRLIKEVDEKANVIISSFREEYDRFGIPRHTPVHNEYEIDRFPAELFDEPVCFLYGDVYYTPEAISLIMKAQPEKYEFFGNAKCIIAAVFVDYEMLKAELLSYRAEIVAGRAPDGKGWQFYHRLEGMPLEGKAYANNFTFIEDISQDFNLPEELAEFLKTR